MTPEDGRAKSFKELWELHQLKPENGYQGVGPRFVESAEGDTPLSENDKIVLKSYMQQTGLSQSSVTDIWQLIAELGESVQKSILNKVIFGTSAGSETC